MTGILDEVIDEWVKTFDNCKCEFCMLIPHEIIPLKEQLAKRIKEEITTYGPDVARIDIYRILFGVQE